MCRTVPYVPKRRTITLLRAPTGSRDALATPTTCAGCILPTPAEDDPSDDFIESAVQPRTIYDGSDVLRPPLHGCMDECGSLTRIYDYTSNPPSTKPRPLVKAVCITAHLASALGSVLLCSQGLSWTWRSGMESTVRVRVYKVGCVEKFHTRVMPAGQRVPAVSKDASVSES